MKWMIFISFAILGFGCKPSIFLQKRSVKLSKPMIESNEIFFEGSTTLVISPTDKKADLIYSIDNSKKQKYKKPIKVDKSSRIIVYAAGGGFIPSDSVTLEVLRLPKSEIISIRSGRALDEQYGKAGLDVLIDKKKGKKDYNNGWLGYMGDTLRFDLEFDIIEVNQVVISTLRNQASWIFDPAIVNIISNDVRVSTKRLDDFDLEKGNSDIFTKIDIPKLETRQLTVEIIAPKEIPSWHPGEGNKPWLFIDEILIY